MGKKKDFPGINLCIVGDKGVGKYSLGQQFAKGWIEPKETNDTPSAQCPTKIFELEEKKFEVKVFICEELNNGDQFNNCDGVAVVFSVTDKASFTWAATALETVNKKFNAQLSNNGIHEQGDEQQSDRNKTESEPEPKIPVILVGNKVDEAKLSREIEEESAKSLSQKYNCAGFFETAAICNAEVPKAFKCLLTEIVRKKGNEATGGGANIVKPQKACCVII